MPSTQPQKAWTRTFALAKKKTTKKKTNKNTDGLVGLVSWHIQSCPCVWLFSLTRQELQKNISCLAGFAKFYKQDFSEAKDLFM